MGGSSRPGAGSAAAVVILVLMAALLLHVSHAPAADGSEIRSPRWHLFFGTDWAEHSFFGHGGLVWAPDGDLDHSGWRIRATGSGGAFDYLAGATAITGELLSAELMPGYQWVKGNAGFAAYAGPTVQDQSTDPYDPGKSGQGTHVGAKALVEGWVRIGDRTILNGSASYASAAESYCARISVAFDVTREVSLEPEVLALGEPGYDAQRLGVLIGYRPYRALQIKIGGGWAHDPDDDGPYAAFQVKLWR